MEKLLVMSGNHKIADQQFYECNVTIKSIHKKICVKIIDVLRAYETSYAHQGLRISMGGEWGHCPLALELLIRIGYTKEFVYLGVSLKIIL